MNAREQLRQDLIQLISALILTTRWELFDAYEYRYAPLVYMVVSLEWMPISNIAYNKRNEKEILGIDQHFAPTCVPLVTLKRRSEIKSPFPFSVKNRFSKFSSYGWKIIYETKHFLHLKHIH